MRYDINHPDRYYSPSQSAECCSEIVYEIGSSNLDFRWDEKADPPRSTLCCVGLQAYASSMWAQNGRRIGP
jgi:hypothetical protein